MCDFRKTTISFCTALKRQQCLALSRRCCGVVAHDAIHPIIVFTQQGGYMMEASIVVVSFLISVQCTQDWYEAVQNRRFNLEKRIG